MINIKQVRTCESTRIGQSQYILVPKAPAKVKVRAES